MATIITSDKKFDKKERYRNHKFPTCKQRYVEEKRFYTLDKEKGTFKLVDVVERDSGVPRCDKLKFGNRHCLCPDKLEKDCIHAK